MTLILLFSIGSQRDRRELRLDGSLLPDEDEDADQEEGIEGEQIESGQSDTGDSQSGYHR
jgi:hypothetical protein